MVDPRQRGGLILKLAVKPTVPAALGAQALDYDLPRMQLLVAGEVHSGQIARRDQFIDYVPILETDSDPVSGRVGGNDGGRKRAVRVPGIEQQLFDFLPQTRVRTAI